MASDVFRVLMQSEQSKNSCDVYTNDRYHGLCFPTVYICSSVFGSGCCPTLLYVVYPSVLHSVPWLERERTRNGIVRLASCSNRILTHICLMDLSILINWTSSFPIVGVSGVFFSFLFCFE